MLRPLSGRSVLLVLAAIAWAVSPAGAETIYQTDFNSGLDSNWTTRTSASLGRVGTKRVDTELSALKFDIKGSSTPVESLNEATLLLDLSSYRDLGFSFDHYVYLDAVDEFNGDDFVDSQAADGIAVSGDGTTWHPLWSPSTTGTGWTRGITIGLDDLVSQKGLSTSAFQIRFQYFGQVKNGTLRNDGRAFDNVSISGTPSTVGVVPAPSAAMLAFIGLCCGGVMYRFRGRANFGGRPAAAAA